MCISLSSLILLLPFLLQLSHALPTKTSTLTGKGSTKCDANKYRRFAYKGKVYKVKSDVMPSRPHASTPPNAGSNGSETTPAQPSTSSHASSDASHRRPRNSLAPTKEEFVKALTDNHYDPPTDKQYRAFVKGLDSSTFSGKREVAMFLAQIMHESGGLKVKSEERCVHNGCPGEYETGEGVPGKRYFGRGYIQPTWSYNYKAASEALFGDPNKLLRHPELVADDEDVAWGTSFWFWRQNVHHEDGVQNGQFGYSTLRINGGLECGGNAGELARRRFRLYTKVLLAFGLKDKLDPTGCY